jgi:hypothetical protein
MTTTSKCRYDWIEIARRVNRERRRRIPPGEAEPLTIEELAQRIGITADQMYKRLGSVKDDSTKAPRTPFTVTELGRIADILGAPRCWPFIGWPVLER